MLDTWRTSIVVSAGETKSNTTFESDSTQREVKSKHLKNQTPAKVSGGEKKKKKKKV